LKGFKKKMVLWSSLSGEVRLSEEGELILSTSLFTSLSYLVVALVAASLAVAEPPVPSWQRGSEGTARRNRIVIPKTISFLTAGRFSHPAAWNIQILI